MENYTSDLAQFELKNIELIIVPVRGLVFGTVDTANLILLDQVVVGEVWDVHVSSPRRRRCRGRRRGFYDDAALPHQTPRVSTCPGRRSLCPYCPPPPRRCSLCMVSIGCLLVVGRIILFMNRGRKGFLARRHPTMN
jgi:hypothetical protein